MRTFVVSFYVIICFYICSSNKRSHFEERIVNGIPTKPSKFPFIASISVIINRKSYPICGGSLLQKEYPAIILTAAHCLSRYENYEFEVDLYRDDIYPETIRDSGDYTEWKSIYTVYHEFFNSTTYDNDVGLIFLNANLTDYDEYEQVIISNDTRYNNSCCHENEELTIIGYGYNEHYGVPTDTLEYSTIFFMNRRECNIELTKWYIQNELDENSTETMNISNNNYWIFVNENQICAMGQDTDACQGDSGGPLMKINTNQQIGIISTGFGCNYNIPAIYTNLGIYYKWIQQQINGYNSNITTTYIETESTNFEIIINGINITKYIKDDDDDDNNNNNMEHENLQLVIGCIVVAVMLCFGFIIYLIRILRQKQLTKYNRMNEEEVSVNNKVKNKKQKNIKRSKDKSKRNEMEGPLNVNTTSKIEMNETKLIARDIS